MKYNNEVKKKVLKRLLDHDCPSISKLSEAYGVSTATLYAWRSNMRKHGSFATSTSGPKGWSSRDKHLAVIATAALNESEKSAYCREKGIYPSDIEGWRISCESANDWEHSKQDELAKALRIDKKRIKELESDLRRKEKALAETAALLVLQKQMKAIWGDEAE